MNKKKSFYSMTIKELDELYKKTQRPIKVSKRNKTVSGFKGRDY